MNIKLKTSHFDDIREDFLFFQVERIKDLIEADKHKKFSQFTIAFYRSNNISAVTCWEENIGNINALLVNHPEDCIAIIEVDLNNEGEKELFITSPIFEEKKVKLKAKPSHLKALKRYPFIRERMFENRIARQQKKNKYRQVKALDIPYGEKRDIKTILFALHWLEHGGAEKAAVDNIIAAKEAGYNIVVITNHNGKQNYLDEILKHTDKLYTLPLLTPNGSGLDMIERIIKYNDVDCVHLHHHSTLYWILPALKYKLPYLKIIDTTHIIEYDGSGFAGLSGQFSQYIDEHHVISRQLVCFLKDKYNVPSRKVHLGYLYEEGKKNLIIEDGLSRKFDDVQSQCNILFVGRAVRQKRPHLVPLIAKKLIRSCRSTEFTFNFVGEGPYLEIVKYLVKKHKLKAHFIFHEASSDVKKLMKENHFLLIPSENEGLTLVAYEAVGANVICVSSDVGSQSEIIADEALLPYVARKTVSEAAQIISKAIKDRKFLEELSAQQTKKVNSLYASAHWKEVVLSLYK